VLTLTGVYYCPYHPVHGVGKYKADSFDRKPNPGMILQAGGELGLCLSGSILNWGQGKGVRSAPYAGPGSRFPHAWRVETPPSETQ